ncbi:MAG: transcriptional repressor LexA [Coxiellaceae bacterium]|nr:transcriptional repressor LexA [Coxiellaceae bacterium]
MITLSQRKTYQYIKSYIEAKGHAPTIAEITSGIGIKSRGVVHRYVKALQDAGLINLSPKRHRNIELTAKQLTMPQQTNQLPLIGAIAAGQPIEAIIDHDPINLADIFLGEHRYALRVKGDSMIDEGIHDGDIVVCEHSNTANNGQIVVALIDNERATLKRIYHDKSNSITLVPANQKLKPMSYPADRVTVQGLYVGLLRIPP